MVDFQEELKKVASQLQSGNGNGDFSSPEYPYLKLRNKELYFPKGKGTSLVFRLLPSADPSNPMGFHELFRSIPLTTRTSQGREVNSTFNLDKEFNPNSKLDNALMQWFNEGRVPSPYNEGKKSKPSKKAKVNVIPMEIDQAGNVNYVLDDQGQFKVQVLTLASTALSSLFKSLADPMINPNVGTPDAGMSFLSAQNSYPIRVTKADKSYDVQIYSNVTLPPLPQGWETLLEDLKYQVTPTEVYSPDFVEFFINSVNGTEVTNQMQAPVQQQQAPVQNPYMANATTQGLQQPVQTPVAPMQTTMPNMPVQQPVQMPAKPIAPIQTPVQMPVQPSIPVTPDMPDFGALAQDPASNTQFQMPGNLEAMPDVLPPTSEPPMQEPITATTPTQTFVANTGDMPDVDALLASMQNKQ